MAVDVAAGKKRLGRRIVTARVAAGLNQRQLAERLVRRLSKHDPKTGQWQREVVSMQRNLRRYENGHNVPRGDVLMLIADETGVEASHFTSDDDEEEPSMRLRRIAAQLVLDGYDEMSADLLSAVRDMNRGDQ